MEYGERKLNKKEYIPKTKGITKSGRIYANSLKCTVPDCLYNQRAKGLCNTHYSKMRITGSLEKIVGTDAHRAKLRKAHEYRKHPVSKIDSYSDNRKGQKASKAYRVVTQIKNDAIKVGYYWDLDPLDVFRLIKEPCVYCGLEAGWPLTRNGIDRVDTTKGYTLDNCTTACIICNRAKGAKSVKEFMEWEKDSVKKTFKESYSLLILLN
jgi:hypothetical protein